MKRFLVLTAFLMLLTACNGSPEVSGNIQAGLRVLDLSEGQNKLVIYRGDYIYPKVAGEDVFSFRIPELGIEKTYPVAEGEKVYVKMKKTGKYEFEAGKAKGIIKVLEYDAVNYSGLTAREAKTIIQNIQPLVLDVRTTGEYVSAHLTNAMLIPVQVLQQEMGRLSAYKDQPILIYCATGNRSTVAARLLIDAGFKQIYNMRYGISDWMTQGYPVVTE